MSTADSGLKQAFGAVTEGMLESMKTKKKLLDWMDDGDPDMIPIVMADAESTAASFFDIPLRIPGQSYSIVEKSPSRITPEMILTCRNSTGIHFCWSLGTVTFLDVVGNLDDIQFDIKEEVGSKGEILTHTQIETPKGVMSDIFVTPSEGPACWRTHLVKSADDLPAFTYLVERVNEAYASDPAIKAKILGKYRSQAAKWAEEEDVVLYAAIGLPTFVLTSNLFMGPDTAAFLLFDHRTEMEMLFEMECSSMDILIDCAAEAGADCVFHAVNGLEIFSPQTYQDYFVPQAAKLHSLAHSAGMRSWVHTCGRLKKLIELGVHQEMDIDVLESFTPPPFGDVDDLKTSRAFLGDDIVTRGAVAVEDWYSEDIDYLRKRTQTVIAETAGYRHMIGDTNDSYPPYPRDSIMAVVDEVEKTGRMLRA